MSRLRTLLSEALAMTGFLFVLFLSFALWATAEVGAVWLCFNGWWFFGVPLFVFAMAAGIVAMDEFA